MSEINFLVGISVMIFQPLYCMYLPIVRLKPRAMEMGPLRQPRGGFPEAAIDPRNVPIE